MKTLILTAGAACALATIWALPGLAASSGTTTDANAAASNATNAATGAGGTSGSSTTNATASGGASTNATAAGATVGAGANASTSSSMTIKDIDTNKPFGDTNVDQTQTPQAIDANLTDAQRQDLASRCTLISDNPTMFAPSVPTWCTQYMSYWKTQHPNQ